jgi:hypothetical protein
MELVTIQDETQQWDLRETEDSAGRYLKVPIAIKGKWQHSLYGEVAFTDQDFDEVINNWSSAKAGFDPPLFLGHPTNDTGSMEGTPAAGWPDKIFREDDVLYGLFSATDESLYDDVKSKKFKYASAEIVRDAKDKETGERIGTLLVGTALTNRPFIPLKDHTVEVVEQKFSEFTTPTVFTFSLINSTESDPMPETLSTPLTEQVVAPAEPAVVPKEQYDALVTEFSNLAKEFSTMKQQFSDLLAKEKERDVELKLSKLESLALPASTKESFSEMIRSGTLSQEAEDKLFSDYQLLSENYKEVFSAQQGAQEDKETKGLVMPEFYSQVMAQHKEMFSNSNFARTMPKVLG